MVGNNEKLKKWVIHTVDLDYGEKIENVENEIQTLYDMKYGEKHWKRWKMRNFFIHTLGPGLLRKNSKTWKMRHKHFSTWYMARKTQTRAKREMHTLGPGIWPEQWKTWKMRNGHYRTWSMARNMKIMENEKHTL